MADDLPRFMKVDAAMEHQGRPAGTGPLALTLGEPAGIGPDITLLAWRRRAELRLPPFYVIADPQLLMRRAERVGLDVPIALMVPETAGAAFASVLPVVDLNLRVTAQPGHPDSSSAAAAIAAIRR